MTPMIHACPSPTKGALRPDTLLAAKTGRLEKVKTYLKEGGDVNASDPTGVTLLFGACENGRTEVLKELLKQPNLHLNTRSIGVTPLAVSAVNGHEECVRALLDSSLQCEVNLNIICYFKNKKPVTAFGGSVLAKCWPVFEMLLDVYEHISPEETCDVINSVIEDDKWSIMEEFLQKDVSFQGSIYLKLLKEAYTRHIWDIINLVFCKALKHDNLSVLLILNEMHKKKDWEKMESLMKVMDDTVKLDINLAEALRGKQSQEVEKMLIERNYDIGTMSGNLLLAAIMGTSDKAAEELMEHAQSYSEETLKFALYLSTINTSLEVLPLLLKNGKFSFKTIGHALSIADFYSRTRSIEFLKLSFKEKARELFTNSLKNPNQGDEKLDMSDSEEDE